ncbi:hypothetical protein AAFF_G00000580 [Aldrovandia affinis]|uniref:Uncharacterized protein n=1 Tax=Aldrovandia affinis TaxID=143900 RepID=A0AAD7X4F5_9TELE|nr:hypothetical protein AAFF_G00000580 [Aldrovandia affinis]
MLNIASVNIPKIKPETKVLIIKNLKSKSPAEVADIFNASKRLVERIRKRYQETGDVHDRPSHWTQEVAEEVHQQGQLQQLMDGGQCDHLLHPMSPPTPERRVCICL